MVPIKIPGSPSTIAAWREDELASYEDLGDEEGVHAYTLLGRDKRALVVNTFAEARTLLESGEYHGDAGGWDDRYAFRAAVARLTRHLRLAVNTQREVA